MYDHSLYSRINRICSENKLAIAGADNEMYTRLLANAAAIHELYVGLYRAHPQGEAEFDALLRVIVNAHLSRPGTLRSRDNKKIKQQHWFVDNRLTGMSLYVDRFCGKLPALADKLGYFKELGVTLLHLMPLFESPPGESDGGYAVSDFRKVDDRFGTLEDLQTLRHDMQAHDIHLMLDIVLNHTSRKHAWAEKAKRGEKKYQDYYYMFDDRTEPDRYDHAMPEIFPEAAPGNFTWIKECEKWVMTVFHDYQWDLNYTNPAVFNAMLDTVFFYANLGVDILRIDAPAFIWKQAGTACQNLPQAHELLRLIRQCVEVAAPGMALLAEAIVAPGEIMQYFGTGKFRGRECDFAYNATQMALQWDALATGDTRVMLAAQQDLLQKPFGCSWITYTRCHDDIGLGFGDASIKAAGYEPYQHRKFLKEYYAGIYPGSTASGALFAVNPKTEDARISGSLASLCGLEKAMIAKDEAAIDTAIQKIILMQSQSFLLGGLPMLFYGDEVGYTNDYSYLQEKGKSYDNRWMHRPLIDWKKNERRRQVGSSEERVFTATQKLIALRSLLPDFADLGNINWLAPYNINVAGFIRNSRIYCLFNYSNKPAYLTWYAFKQLGAAPKELYDHWHEKKYRVGADHEYLVLDPYAIHILEPDR